MRSFLSRFGSAVTVVSVLGGVAGFWCAGPISEANAVEAILTPDVATATLQGLEQTRYGELRRLYDDRMLADGKAWAKTAQGQRVRNALSRLITEAGTVTTVDPEDPAGPHVLNYTGINGKVVRFTSIVTSNVESDASIRAEIGIMIARFIVDNATQDGLFLYDVSSPEREVFEKGIIAAKQGDYPGALGFFKEAQQTAPYAADLYYNMGLTESMMKGRELRAISWFGAYLASKPDTASASAVRARMAALKIKSENMIRGLLQLAEDTAKEFSNTYNHENALYRTAVTWAMVGDVRALERIADLITDPDQKSYTLHLLVKLHLEHGDLQSAQSAAEPILDLFTKCKAQVDIAETKLKAGDADGVRITLAWVIENIKLVEDAYYRSVVLTSVAETQIKLNDIEAAKETLAASKENIALYSLCYSVVDAQNLIAEAETHAGDAAAAEETFAAAQKTLEALNDNSLYGNIAEARARTGNIAAAFEAAAKIEDVRGWKQDFARQAIMEAQIKAGDIAGAQETVDEMGDSFKSKAQLLINETKAKRGVDRMDWIINLDDEDFLAGGVFLDITEYMKRLWIADDPGADFELVLSRAREYFEGHQIVDQMVQNLAELQTG